MVSDAAPRLPHRFDDPAGPQRLASLTPPRPRPLALTAELPAPAGTSPKARYVQGRVQGELAPIKPFQINRLAFTLLATFMPPGGPVPAGASREGRPAPARRGLGRGV
jgi:hypothetical protein